MPVQLPVYIRFIAAFLLAVGVSLYAVKKIIFVTRHRRIFDIPDNIRKIHGAQIPSLGGIGIFTGYMAAAAFFMDPHWYVVMAASALLFFTGIYDDIMNMRPSKKLATQLLASCILVFLADVRIRSLHGIAGIQDLSYPVSAALTIVACTFFINVFNFMDGIDGLASTLAILYTLVPGLLLANVGDYSHAGIAFSLAGASAGLLWYNIAPARIYMGDTGSMFLGFTIFVFSLAVSDAYNTAPVQSFNVLPHPASALTLMLALSCVPVIDALRVFVIRISQGASPLHADRNHIHYYLLDAGLSHSGAVIVIAGLNGLLLATAWLMRSVAPLLTIGLIAAATLVFLSALSLIRRRTQRQPLKA